MVPNASGTIDDGIKAEGRYFNPGIATGTNYGFLQNGTSTIPKSELNSVFPSPSPSPVPATYNCVVRKNALGAFSMSGTIKPSSADVGKPGYYFVAGYDRARNEWWSFDGVNWLKHNGTNANYLPIAGSGGSPLSAVGISRTIFTNSDLTAFPNGEIYLGYGVGTTQSVAWNNLSDAKKYKLCATLPSL